MRRNKLFQTLAILELLENGELNTTHILQRGVLDNKGLRVLSALVAHKLVLVERRKGLHGAPSNFYRLTRKGRQTLNKWKKIKEMFGVRELSELS